MGRRRTRAEKQAAGEPPRRRTRFDRAVPDAAALQQLLDRLARHPDPPLPRQPRR